MIILIKKKVTHTSIRKKKLISEYYKYFLHIHIFLTLYYFLSVIVPKSLKFNIFFSKIAKMTFIQKAGNNITGSLKSLRVKNKRCLNELYIKYDK